ncbi:MAG: hypothetical protein IPL52_14285 [Flavobacteriales bacterium]|nr:hypothetical protein [Flavobacteriales bacterium]
MPKRVADIHAVPGRWRWYQLQFGPWRERAPGEDQDRLQQLRYPDLSLILPRRRYVFACGGVDYVVEQNGDYVVIDEL